MRRVSRRMATRAAPPVGLPNSGMTERCGQPGTPMGGTLLDTVAGVHGALAGPAPVGRAKRRWVAMVRWPGAARQLNGSRGATPTPRSRAPTGRPPWGRRTSSCWRPRPISSAGQTSAGGRCDAPIALISTALIRGGPRGACSGWRSPCSCRVMSRRPVVGSPARTVSWSTSRGTAPSADSCCFRPRSRRLRPAITRAPSRRLLGRPRSAPGRVTPTCSRSRCTSRAGRW